MKDRRSKVKKYLEKHTKRIVENHSFVKEKGFDAINIAIDLDIGRANVSRILNELWRNGEAIKIQGRPILYLDFDVIKNEYPNHYIPTFISNNTKIEDYIEKGPIKKDIKNKLLNSPLDNIVGSNGTMKQEIEKFVAALSYPPSGLPVLVIGDEGSKKRNFIQSIFDYAIYRKIKEEKSTINIIDCQEYVQNEELFLGRLLGQKSKESARFVPGAIESSNRGVVYLENIDKLSYRSLVVVTDIIANSSYTRLGDNRIRKMDSTFVLSISSNAETQIVDIIKENVPVVVVIPAFDRRNVYEKIETILFLFTKEAINTNRNIVINKSVIVALAISKFPGNESQLQNEIKSSCANAYMNQEEKAGQNVIYIDLGHLSNYILSRKNNAAVSERDYITLARRNQHILRC